MYHIRLNLADWDILDVPTSYLNVEQMNCNKNYHEYISIGISYSDCLNFKVARVGQQCEQVVYRGVFMLQITTLILRESLLLSVKNIEFRAKLT